MMLKGACICDLSGFSKSSTIIGAATRALLVQRRPFLLFPFARISLRVHIQANHIHVFIYITLYWFYFNCIFIASSHARKSMPSNVFIILGLCRCTFPIVIVNS